MAPASPSAFVGREAELARLAATLEEAGDGGAPAIVIEGESGAGKTRLLREFAAVAAGRGATVLFGRCVDCGEAGPPYWPFLEALRALGRTEGERAPEGRAGAPAAEPPADPGQPDAGTGQPPAGLFERVLDRLETAGRRSPVVLVIDDLHWADRSTRELLGFLLANLAGGPGPLVVTAVRSEALLPGHPLLGLLAELRRSRRADFVTLDRLGREDVATLVASTAGAEPEPDVVDEIWRRSDGNPFFVEELAAAARSGRSLTATLEPILAARLGALSPGARAAAGVVAAGVGPIPHRLVAEVAGLAEPALSAGLRECVDHHVLVTDARAGTYVFRHSLLRDAAYA
ncbi:MAG: AAA family ATPase, partial [Actinobacteria bacterium]|nr:AAA family ATPase [Actinomycetota bacterium]